jgi:hypothetical protein
LSQTETARSGGLLTDASLPPVRLVWDVADGRVRPEEREAAQANPRRGTTSSSRRRPKAAGKSTFVETFLKPTGILIVNPEEVAKGLSPDSPETVAYEAACVADAWRRDWLLKVSRSAWRRFSPIRRVPSWNF